MNLESVAERLQFSSGPAVTFTARGGSMTPLVTDGQEVSVYPMPRPEFLVPGDVVVARVEGRVYLHKVLAVDQGRHRVQIGNNHGRVNGWTGFAKVYGVMR
jgi:hypothetical protein